MSIKPNIQIYQTPASNLQNIATADLISLPDVIVEEFVDVELIDKIRNQPLPNDISTLTNATKKEEIADLVKLLGQFCTLNSLDNITTVIREIHEKLNDKEPHVIKNWVRLLTGLHPTVDAVIKEELPYFKNPFSEVIGTNTISYYADESAIDLWFWAKTPIIENNTVEFFLDAYPSPTYIRESVRQKLSNEVIEMIQDSNRTINKRFRNAIIYDALITTADVTGSEVPQGRPIPYKEAHGASLNNDWYHQSFRILDGERNKFWGKHDAIFKLYEPHPDGYFVHLLFNYITPLTPEIESEDRAYTMKSPLGVEETFPKAKFGLTTNVSSNGQPIRPSEEVVNDDSIVPEVTE